MRGRHQALALRQDIFYILMNELITRVVGGKIRLREISQPHVVSIKNYILTNLENKNVHIPPLVGHLEHGSLCFEGNISIIDGSHRLKACVQLQQLAINTIDRKGELERQKAFQVLDVFEHTNLPIQLHEGLTVEEQHQYYLDLNSLREQTSGDKHIGEEDNGHDQTLGQKSGLTEPKDLITSWVYQL
ncbi:MAG: hypothetical protein ACQEXB_12025 [Bacillota bacterium]